MSDISKRVNELDQDLNGMARLLIRLEARQEDILQELTVIAADVKEVKTEVAAVKTDVAAVKSDFAALSSDMTAGMTAVKSDVAKILAILDKPR